LIGDDEKGAGFGVAPKQRLFRENCGISVRTRRRLRDFQISVYRRSGDRLLPALNRPTTFVRNFYSSFSADQELVFS